MRQPPPVLDFRPRPPRRRAWLRWDDIAAALGTGAVIWMIFAALEIFRD